MVWISLTGAGSSKEEIVSPREHKEGTGPKHSSLGLTMGRKAGVMRVNPKTLTRKTLPCFQEMLVFLSCLQKFNYDDDKCMNEKRALNMCMELQAKQGKQQNTINYHLQRISRMMKSAG